MSAMTNEETDTALILEGELRRRVHEIAERVVVNMVGKIIQDELRRHKEAMMMEVSINVGKMLRVVDGEHRKPLWESKPEDFGFDHKELNTHMLEKGVSREI
jgi:hypothetical protein